MNPQSPFPTTRLYQKVWGGLMVLLLATWGAAQFDLGPLNVAAALIIALVKSLLVILYFMHVRYQPRFTWLFVAAGFFWLSMLFALTLSDYLTRG